MKRIRIKKVNIELLLLILILLFGFFLRIYGLGDPPLWIDEAISSMASKMILEKGLPIFDSGLLYSRAYVFHYVQAFFLLFGQTDFLVRFASVIFGLLTIVLVYSIGKEYSKSGGLISALFMSVFYLEVFFSRQARFYQLFQLMFFLSLYLLYKSKDNPKYLVLALISFFITYDTHLAGLVLAVFFIVHILIYNKKFQKLFSILPAIVLIKQFIPTASLASKSQDIIVNHAGQYFSFARNMMYMLILVIPGVVWAFFRKKRLTILMIVPSLILLIGVINLQTFALRYSYFIVFPLVLYIGVLMSFLYEKFGEIMLFSIFLLLIFPSNLVFPYTGVNIIKPINYNYNDYSSPEINLKQIPQHLYLELNNEENTVVTFFSSSFEWYIRKPDYVLVFSMDGRGDDQISYKTNGDVVDVYSGALILTEDEVLEKPYYVIVDDFSKAKLKPYQKDNLEKLVEGCGIEYVGRDVDIFKC
jgi:hypothetical protein